MNARIRGLLIFGIIIAVAVIFCGLLPFVWLPSMGYGMALPVITVPGEVVSYGALPGGVNLTNTLIGIFVADALVIIFALLAWRSSKGWTKEVPGRFQAFVEMLVETLYNFLKNLGGDRLRNTPLLWPLVATIFLLLLSANMSKLFPGVESVGKMHCAHVGFNGYPMVKGTGSDSSYLLYVDSALDAGSPQTLEAEEACIEWFNAFKAGHVKRFVPASGHSYAEVQEELETEKAALEAKLAEAAADSDEAKLLKEEIHFLELQIASAGELVSLAPVLAAQQAALEAATAKPASDSHGSTDSHGEAASHSEPTVDVAALQAELDATQQAYNRALSGLQYPGATLALSAEQLDKGAIPFIFHITPFVRGAASDLSLTVAYALMTVVLVQIYGIYALGPAYFEKFINLTALGNLSKRPLGAVDFLVGIFEIISEIGKIISLAFRLFGNIFAGGVALIAISFLVSILVPGVILLLEIVIGAVQALVFSVLTLVFIVQAMEHHGGGDHDHGHGDEAHGHH